ncbi:MULTISPECIES: carbon-nitrogen hydrolase family protein [Halomonadaceae]|jgi:predicted amidohydrolase|uniref:Predicted amidohydrolase n=1 Tax=Vreelandella subterranea TaxID=416874 RepID=A0A1H9S8J3_9GAMM|nr:MULTISPECIES: carbon-nitrogen hydrolase family protein [Halomonas]MCO7245501.1 carbon-nitrogen hydrolase family protein [Halomonas sp. Mc5H-6]OAZ89403.1 hydrolase [Halomonas sp. G11]SER81317.1 Predicted amidohydrolase [Halomonas subterranea]
MSYFTIAGVQMHALHHGDNTEAMRHRVDALMARFPQVQMVLFSELMPMGASPHHAQPLPSDTEAMFCQLALQHRIWLIPGSMFEQVGEHIYNTSVVINPMGQVVARYRKMFPFRPFEAGVESGSEFVVFDVPNVGRFGISICYDMWFPETTRTLAAMGAEVILHPTMTDTIDRDLELSIARTNAALNQCYFFDINGAGALGNGRSIVVGPSGDVIHQAGSGEQVIPIEIDLNRVRRERERGLHGLGQPLKSFRDRKVNFSLYANEGGSSAFLDTLGPLVKPGRADLETPPEH